MVRDHARRLSNIVLGVVLKDKTLAKIFEEVEMRDEVVGGLALGISRVVIPITLVLIILLLWALKLPFLAIAIITGICVGPVVGLHRLYFYKRYLRNLKNRQIKVV